MVGVVVLEDVLEYGKDIEIGIVPSEKSIKAEHTVYVCLIAS